MDLAAATAETFRPHIGTDFHIANPSADGGVIRLTDVQVTGVQPHAPRTEPFSLVFLGPGDPRLDQGMYELRHDALGPLELFLVPIGYEAGGGLRYEAVFN
jgi:hypothetical protein